MIAIFSDIHSNMEALTACCNVAEAQGVQRYICLGDSVGYGPEPVAVLDKLLSLPGFVSVMGNHDEYLLRGAGVFSDPYIKQATQWTRQQLQPRHLDFIKSLDYLHVEDGVTYTHASVCRLREWEYLLELKQIKQCMDAAETNLVFVGHVHIPAVFHEETNGEINEIQPSPDNAIPLHPNRRYVVNVGSVGQPRDNNSKACFVIYDEEKHAVTFYRVDYDYQKTARKIRAAGLPDYYGERLISGL